MVTIPTSTRIHIIPNGFRSVGRTRNSHTRISNIDENSPGRRSLICREFRSQNTRDLGRAIGFLDLLDAIGHREENAFAVGPLPHSRLDDPGLWKRDEAPKCKNLRRPRHGQGRRKIPPTNNRAATSRSEIWRKPRPFGKSESYLIKTGTNLSVKGTPIGNASRKK